MYEKPISDHYRIFNRQVSHPGPTRGPPQSLSFCFSPHPTPQKRLDCFSLHSAFAILWKKITYKEGQSLTEWVCLKHVWVNHASNKAAVTPYVFFHREKANVKGYREIFVMLPSFSVIRKWVIPSLSNKSNLSTACSGCVKYTSTVTLCTW